MPSAAVNDRPSPSSHDAWRDRPPRGQAERPPNVPDTVFLILGGGHFVFAGMSMILGILSMIAQSYGFWVGTPIWTGVAFFITGSLGYGMGRNRKNKYMVAGFITMSSVSVVMAVVLLLNSSVALSNIQESDTYECPGDPDETCSPSRTATLTVNILLIMTATAELAFCITSILLSVFAVKWDRERARLLRDRHVRDSSGDISSIRDSNRVHLPNYGDAIGTNIRHQYHNSSDGESPSNPSVRSDHSSFRQYRYYSGSPSREMLEMHRSLSNVSTTDLTPMGSMTGDTSQGLENVAVDILQNEHLHRQSLPDITLRIIREENEPPASHGHRADVVAYDDDDNDSIPDVTFRIVHERHPLVSDQKMVTNGDVINNESVLQTHLHSECSDSDDIVRAHDNVATRNRLDLNQGVHVLREPTLNTECSPNTGDKTINLHGQSIDYENSHEYHTHHGSHRGRASSETTASNSSRERRHRRRVGSDSNTEHRPQENTHRGRTDSHDRVQLDIDSSGESRHRRRVGSDSNTEHIPQGNTHRGRTDSHDRVQTMETGNELTNSDVTHQPMYVNTDMFEGFDEIQV